MTFSLLWLPQVLRDAGLKVTEVPGWQNRGHGDEGNVLGVLCHHTCGPLHGDLPDLNVLIDGRPDLGGPLCNLGLGRSGTYWMIAAGKGWHAGAGNWQGVTDGNGHLIGIEAENIGTSNKDGTPQEPWPAVQMDAYKRGVAAILKHVGAKPIMCAGHKEYALPHGRKDDPNFDMGKFRADVAAIMAGPIGKPAPTPVPVNVQLPQATYDEGLEFLQTNLVSLNYHDIGTIDGLWGGKTRGSITAFMNDRGKSPDGLTTDAGWVSQAARTIVTDEVGRAIDEGWSRPIAPARANATAKDIAPQVEAVRQSLWQRFIAKLAGTGAGGVALVTGVGSQFGSVDAQMSPVKQYFANIPGWAWFSLIALAALAVFLSADKSQNATVKDYNTGKIN